jgi:hypothetical protein
MNVNPLKMELRQSAGPRAWPPAVDLPVQDAVDRRIPGVVRGPYQAAYEAMARFRDVGSGRLLGLHLGPESTDSRESVSRNASEAISGVAAAVDVQER